MYKKNHEDGDKYPRSYTTLRLNQSFQII